MLTDETPDLAGQELDGGRYLIRKPLDAGGMGAVWLATATRMNADVVVKFPHAELLSQKGFKQRFENEIRSLITLSHRHPSIVKILDVGEHQGTPYAVMQYLGGGSVRDWALALRSSPRFWSHAEIQELRQLHDGLDKAPPGGADLLKQADRRQALVSQRFDWRKELRWLEEAADALDFVHQNALVHRDIKPQNILFDESRRAHLADFGIMKFVDKPATEMSMVTGTSQIVGTMGYMAPEVLLGEAASGRSDQYSLAVTFYEALCGERPFRGETPGAICVAQQNSRPKSLALHCPYLPNSIQAVVEKALHKTAEMRFESCLAFAVAVQECLAAQGKGRRPSEPAVAAEIVNAQMVQPALPGGANQGTARLSSVKAETASRTMPGPQPAVPPSATPPQTAPPRPSGPPPLPLRPPSGAAIDKTQPVPSQRAPVPSRGGKSGELGESPFAPPVPPPLPKAGPAKAPSSQSAAVSGAKAASGSRTKFPGAKKQVVCPWCWQKFSPADVLWIAEHHDLVGDAKIRDGFHRFLPEKYSADCRAIDARGTICTNTACPNCHLLLPREFIDFEPAFVSVLGIPSSGKSCFLTSMCWQLRATLPKFFRYAFSDASAELNQPIIQSEQDLFLSNSDDLVTLGKTLLEGDSYARVSFAGREVTYLRPYVFSLRPTPQHPNHHAASSISYALGIYDNAGEHFLPGADKNDIPVTRHLISSEAILFVFDPSQHPRFRQKCEAGNPDPQFQRGYYKQTVRQETVLIEAMNRIRRFGNLSLHDKLTKPLIVLINKYDAWASKFELKRFSNPWVQTMPDYPASLDTGRIANVSSKMRMLMQEYCPEVVAAAEDLSSNVTYLPVSAFGRRVETEAGSGIRGVRPNQLNPMWVEVPLLHVLSTIRRGVIPRV